MCAHLANIAAEQLGLSLVRVAMFTESYLGSLLFPPSDNLTRSYQINYKGCSSSFPPPMLENFALSTTQGIPQMSV